MATGSGKSVEKCEELRFDMKKSPNYRVRAPAMPFASPQPRFVSKDKFFSRCSPRNSGPQSRDSPPKRDTGIANEKDWGISLLNENVIESGTGEDGSTWYRESGEDLGENGHRCRWTRMGGQSHDGTSEWKETVKENEFGSNDSNPETTTTADNVAIDPFLQRKHTAMECLSNHHHSRLAEKIRPQLHNP
ncbi:hypothetical protein Adt_39942 [Abeliophyllum distichum]|uniref:Uncharacterized protein n=1 Tax=Abeliophyllum distichum TaxID=126358 RepID=A0ABD1QAS4_9LAMI